MQGLLLLTLCGTSANPNYGEGCQQLYKVELTFPIIVRNGHSSPVLLTGQTSFYRQARRPQTSKFR